MDLKKYIHGFQRQDQDGIWQDTQGKEVSGMFSNQLQDRLFALEDQSWWFRYRAGVICMFAAKYLRKDRDIFDVGGGNGYTTMCMQKKGYAVALLEPSYGACINAVNRGIRTVVCGTLDQEHVTDDSVPQFLLLDVLEHMQDDAAFLKLMGKKLSSGGRILLTVPAFEALWSSEDTAAGHYRRYTVRQLKETAQHAGLHVCYAGYFFGFLVIPILLVRVWMEKAGFRKPQGERTEDEKKRVQEKQFLEKKGLVQTGRKLMESVERRNLKRGKKIKFGSSIVCVLEKDSDKSSG